MTEVPVFHIPIGRTRRQDGEIVLFENDADQDAAAGSMEPDDDELCGCLGRRSLRHHRANHDKLR